MSLHYLYAYYFKLPYSPFPLQNVFIFDILGFEAFQFFRLFKTHYSMVKNTKLKYLKVKNIYKF